MSDHFDNQVELAPATARGTVRVPGSKSVTHRAFLLAAQCPAPCTVARPLRSADTDATLATLHGLGLRMQPDERAVRFLPAEPVPPTRPLDCRNSGTTLRLMTATAARFAFPVTLTGDDSLRGRPNAPLLAALGSLGARVDGHDTAPFTVQGPVHAGQAGLPAKTSSQYASALLLALPFLPGDSRVHLAAPVSSRPYLDVTARVAAAFGLRMDAAEDDDGMDFHVPGHQVPRRDVYVVEGDWSTAAFPLVAAAITGGDVTVEGLDAESPQGDRAVLDLLASFGADVHAGPDGVRVQGRDLGSPGRVDVAATPDLFPILTVLAACSRGKTTFTGGAALRHKESDRIRAMAEGLAGMGIEVDERPDGLVVHGGTLQGGKVHVYDDHRIHMAFAVAGLAAKGKTVVDGASSAAVSYPGFHADLARLTGKEVTA